MILTKGDEATDPAVTPDFFRRVDAFIWLVIGAVSLVDIAASLFGPFVISWTLPIGFAALCGLLAAAGYFYRHVRRDEQIASVLICTVQMLCFAAVSAPLSYVAATANLPLWDGTLMVWDKHLGLDWTAWLAFMEAHPCWHLPLSLAYMSLVAQPFAFILILAATRRFLQLRIFLASTLLTILVTIAISMICPAAGPGLDPLYAMAEPKGFSPASWVSWPIFNALRDGTYRHLFTRDMEGIVQFPSYHAAAGLLGIFAMWPLRYARWVSLVLNIAMIVSTAVDGGHYFVDVFAGLLVAVLCWKVAAVILGTYSASLPIANDKSISIVPSMITAALESHELKSARQHARTEVI